MEYTLKSFVIDNNKIVCSDQFHMSYIEVDKQAHLLGCTPKQRNLKPSILSFREYEELKFKVEQNNCFMLSKLSPTIMVTNEISAKKAH